MPPPNSPDPTVVHPGWHPDPWGQAALRWWDGNTWTPHLSHPAQAHPSVDPVALTERAESTAAWLTKLVFLMPVFVSGTILSFGLTFSGLFDIIDDIDSSRGSDGHAQLDRVFGDVGTITTGFVTIQLLNFLGVAVLIVRMVWTYRITTAARALGRTSAREPGLACAAWIIPIVNFWWPFQTMRDLFPVDQRPDNRLAVWWAGHLLSTLALGCIVVALFLPTSALIALAAFGGVSSAVSAVLERRLVREATALVRQHADSC